MSEQELRIEGALHTAINVELDDEIERCSGDRCTRFNRLVEVSQRAEVEIGGSSKPLRSDARELVATLTTVEAYGWYTPIDCIGMQADEV